MIQVRRAKRYDIKKINELLKIYAFSSVDESYINPRDIALVALDSSKVVGFLWLGLMRQNRLGYLDFFTVDPAYTKKGVGNLLAIKMLECGMRSGVDRVFGIIAHDIYHDKSAKNALKMAMSSDGKIYTQVKAHVPHMISELRGKL